MSTEKEILQLAIQKAQQSVFSQAQRDKAPLSLLQALNTGTTNAGLLGDCEQQAALRTLQQALDTAQKRLGTAPEPSDLGGGETAAAPQRDMALSRAAAELLQAAVALADKRDSDLKRFGYDLVFAVTLGAVGSQLGRYIDKVAGKLSPAPLFIVRGGWTGHFPWPMRPQRKSCAVASCSRCPLMRPSAQRRSAPPGTEPAAN